MKIKISDHQTKSEALRRALAQAGHELVKSWPDVLLIDFDAPVAHYAKTIEQAYSEGAKVLLYSHGAPVITAWDGVWEPSDNITAYLAQSPGQKAVMEAYNYPHPVHVIGWHFCRLKKFAPAKKIENILFAPWHPHSNGWMIPQGKALNADIFRRLAEMPYHLTVRHVRAPHQNGFEQLDGIEYQPSDMTIDGAVRAIDAADLVITSPGTLAALAVARGKPLVMYGQDICPHDGYSAETLLYVNHWDQYKHLMRYPYDISETKPKATQNIIEYAAQREAEMWRARFIGEPMSNAAFVRLVEELCKATP